MRWLDRIISLLAALLLLLSLNRSGVRLEKPYERVYMQASQHAFDFTSWTFNAIAVKLGQSALATPRYFTPGEQNRAVRDYFHLLEEVEKLENQVADLYANPEINDPETEAAAVSAELQAKNRQFQALAPFAEGVLEAQVGQILVEQELTLGGQPLPWVLYHVTPLPNNLVVSRRDKVEQLTNFIIDPGLSLDEVQTLESKIQQNMENTSALVVPVGGVATYPTMVMRSNSLRWSASTVAHEWIHLYLDPKPLGQYYGTRPEVRTMNETTASIAGDEIGLMVMERFYPDLVHRFDAARQLVSLPMAGAIRPPKANFDFNREMHLTRLTADMLLAQGKIEEAETYMEARRKVFWERGHRIRKINQAYFAFFGAYADQPGGAAGEDPVGPAVRELRKRSASLKEFLETIGEMDSFEDLKAALGQP